MMCRWSWLAFACWLIATPLFAIDPPKTPPPELGEAELGPGDALQLTFRGWPPAQVPPGSYMAVTMAGQRLDDASVKRHFAIQKPVLVIIHGKRIDPFYTAVFKPETVVLYIRPQAWKPRAPQPAAARLDPPTSSSPLVFVHHLQQVPEPARIIMPGAATAPLQVTGSVANGKITLVDYDFVPFPLAKHVDEPDAALPAAQPARIVTETVWVPEKGIIEYTLADCQPIGYDGKPLAPVDLAARLAEERPILWLDGRYQLDVRFCEFLKPDVLIVKTPRAPLRVHDYSLSRAPHLEFYLAQAQGDDLTLTQVVFEHHIKKVEYQVEVNGKLETRFREVRETFQKPIMMKKKLSDYQAVSPKRTGLEAEWTLDDLQKHLAKEVPVLICELPHLVPKQLQLLQPGILILKAKENQDASTAPPAPPSS